MTRRILSAIALLVLGVSVHAEVWQARYGVAETFNFKLYNADGTLDVDEADGGTEVSVSCNEGAETTATNDFVDEGTFYSIALTSGEMSCERIAVVIAATTTEAFFIQTIDNTSAMTPMIVQTGDAFARLGAPAGASVSADIVVLDNFVDDLESRVGTPSNLGGGATVAGNLSDIEAQTDDIGAAGAGLTNIDLPNQTMDITGTLSTVTSVTNIVTANATQISGDSAAADALELAFDGTATGARIFGIDRLGTAQSATGTTLVVDSGAAYGDNTLAGATAVACGSTQGYCQSLPIESNVGSTDTLTLAGTWPVTPSGTISFQIWMTAPSTGGSGATPQEVWEYATRTLTALDEDTTTLDLNATAVGSVAGAVGSVTGAVGTVNAIAANAITAAATATDFGTEIGTATWATTTRVLTAGTNIALAKGTGVTGFNDLSAAQVNAEADTALTDIHLDRLFATDYDPASKPGTATALLNELVESDAGVTRFTANALEQAPTGTGESLAAIADAVWDELLSGHAVSGSSGEALTSAAAGGGLDAAGVRSAIGLATANLDTQLGAIKSDTAATLVDTAEIGVAGAGLTATDDAVMTRLGAAAGASVSADIAAVKADTAATLVDTAEIGVAGAGLTAVDDAVLAAIAALNNLSATQLRDLVIEDQGSGVSLGCALSVILAYAAGDLATTGTTPTYEDPSGTETRATGTIASTGNRTMTITCPTY